MAGPITWKTINSRTSAQDLLALQRANQGIQDAFKGAQTAFGDYQGMMDQGNMLQLTNALQNAQTPEEVADIQRDPRAQQLIQSLNSFENQGLANQAFQKRTDGIFDERQTAFKREQFQQQVDAQPYMNTLQQAIFSGDPERVRAVGMQAPNLWGAQQATQAFNDVVARSQKERELTSMINARDVGAAVTKDAGAMARTKFNEEETVRNLTNQEKVNEFTDKFENRQLAQQTKLFSAHINDAVETEFQHSADLAVETAKNVFGKDYTQMIDAEKDAVFAIVQRDNPGTMDIRKRSRSEILTNRLYDYASENNMVDTQANELVNIISQGAKGKAENKASLQGGEAYVSQRALESTHTQLEREYMTSPVKVSFEPATQSKIKDWQNQIDEQFKDKGSWAKDKRKAQLSRILRDGFMIDVPDPKNPGTLTKKRVYVDDSVMQALTGEIRNKGDFNGFIENFLYIPTIVSALATGVSPEKAFENYTEDPEIVNQLYKAVVLESKIWEFNSNPAAKKLGLQVGKKKDD